MNNFNNIVDFDEEKKGEENINFHFLYIFCLQKVGTFLASQSDDRTVRVWRTKDWSCDKVIKEPFEECGGTTHVLRLSWSPDGLYLVSAHAMNGGSDS